MSVIFPWKVKEVSNDVKYLGEFPVFAENVTLVLGRITPMKNKHFGSYGFPNSVIRQCVVPFT